MSETHPEIDVEAQTKIIFPNQEIWIMTNSNRHNATEKKYLSNSL